MQHVEATWRPPESMCVTLEPKCPFSFSLSLTCYSSSACSQITLSVYASVCVCMHNSWHCALTMLSSWLSGCLLKLLFKSQMMFCHVTCAVGRCCSSSSREFPRPHAAMCGNVCYECTWVLRRIYTRHQDSNVGAFLIFKWCQLLKLK